MKNKRKSIMSVLVTFIALQCWNSSAVADVTKIDDDHYSGFDSGVTDDGKLWMVWTYCYTSSCFSWASVGDQFYSFTTD